MANIPTGPAQYLARFADQSIACSQYALAKLGVDRAHCFLKMDDYIILCAPFQLGFKRSIFLASLSKQELTFFQRYVNGIVGLSIAFASGKQEPIKLYIRCTLVTVGPMKGRDNVGLFVVDFKSTPDDLTSILGNYLETQERFKILAEDYGKTLIRMNADVAKLLGYNMYATITEPAGSRRIQIYNFNTKILEHLEAGLTGARTAGSSVAYQMYFKKYRISTAGTIESSTMLPKGIVRTVANLSFSPELAEIVDDYWFHTRSNPQASAQA
jgi:hypothetical protein